jgi:hypothetical protein
MTARDHPQCTVFLAAGIELKPQRNHLVQYLDGRLNMENVGLH